MTPERWQQIEKVYYDARERDGEERMLFLDQACAGDDELRREVESLLASGDQAGDFMGTPALREMADELSGDPAQSLPGQLVGRYKVLSLLGAGGMGEVYLAEDLQLRRKAALKLLPKEFTSDRERLLRFEQEARAASALNHPNIITIYEIGAASTESMGLHFIAAEYVDGQTLRRRMRQAPMTLGEALDVAVQVASALAVAHQAGIVHRDIKPENVMLRHDGYVKVLDFGLAKLTTQATAAWNPDSDPEASTRDLIKTDPGKMMGTARYMSPEQIRGQEVDGRSDVFSLGVMFYEMVAARAPFNGATAGEMMAAILNSQPPPITQHTREAPSELERIVNRALMKDREARYQTVNDLLKDLKSLKLELEFAAKLRQAAGPGEDGAEAADQFTAAVTRPLVTESLYSTQVSPPSLASQESLESVGGAVPLDSEFYVMRPTDAEFHAALSRRDSIVLIKGARQVGKTSLLARGLQRGREAGAKVVLTDFQSLNAECLESVENLFLAIAGLIADQLDLDVFPDQVWHQQLSPSVNFERYWRREVLAKSESPIVWGMDEVDQLFTCDFGSEVFGLFRSWHNKRALDPAGPWRRLTLAIVYATEAHLFITDMNQSPFNVGTRLQLEDFTAEQAEELNRRYGSPLRDRTETARFFDLVGGHPYLVRRGLYEMVARGIDFTALEARADHDEGPYGDHLHRLLLSLMQDAALCDVVRGVLRGQPCPTPESFYRLRSAGLMAGDSPKLVRPRCQLYTRYLERNLL